MQKSRDKISTARSRRLPGLPLPAAELFWVTSVCDSFGSLRWAQSCSDITQSPSILPGCLVQGPSSHCHLSECTSLQCRFNFPERFFSMLLVLLSSCEKLPFTSVPVSYHHAKPYVDAFYYVDKHCILKWMKNPTSNRAVFWDLKYSAVPCPPGHRSV